MEKKWNLQDIRPPERPKRSSRTVRPQTREGEVERSVNNAESSPKRSVKGGKKKLGVFVFVGFLLLITVVGIIVAVLTGGAEVTVFPRLREPTVNATFEAKREAGAGELSYELLTLEAEGEREVSATGEEEVSTQATGNITVYNKTADSQRLRTGTRFRSEGGLIFKIKDSIDVPGGTNENPGTIMAEIYADQAGEEYNLVAGTRFNVPGFEEGGFDELYTAVYAENLVSFSGGYKGPRFIIDDTELNAAKESLQSELRQALYDRVEGERPAGFTLPSSAITFIYRDLPPEEVGNGRVKLKQKAILQAPIFKNEDFASFIAAAVIPGYEGEPVRIDDMSALTFEYTAPTEDLVASPNFSFRLTGKPKLVWTFDAEQLKKDLAGGSETALNTVLGGYPAIERATAAIRPFWQNSFPENPSDIAIVESLEQK